MPNKPRPRCPKCGAAMAPLFRKGARGTSYVRAGSAFQCPTCDILAQGRGKRAEFMGA